MLGGGGVDGAIHRAAGRALLDECRRVAEVRPGVRCPTGEARITAGHALPAKHVIHTVGPIWNGGSHGEPALLASCYRTSFRLCAEHAITSVAFPAISTGVFGYPLEDATEIAVREARAADPSLRIVFCCFSERAARVYAETLSRHPASGT